VGIGVEVDVEVGVGASGDVATVGVAAAVETGGDVGLGDGGAIDVWVGAAAWVKVDADTCVGVCVELDVAAGTAPNGTVPMNAF
jgi:hypothetical protein